MSEYPDETYFTLAPDRVCEVLSPSTRAVDQSLKRAIYAREGVGWLWFVDPDVRTLEAFELRDGQWLLLDTLKENEPVSLPPFEGISFSLGDLWFDGGQKSDHEKGDGTA